VKRCAETPVVGLDDEHAQLHADPQFAEASMFVVALELAERKPRLLCAVELEQDAVLRPVDGDNLATGNLSNL